MQMIAHKGSVYTLDWHPDPDEKNTLATGGRDNMVKVCYLFLLSYPAEVRCLVIHVIQYLNI